MKTHSYQPWQLSFKRWCAPSFRHSDRYRSKEAHSRKEGTPSLRGRHKMFKLFKQTNCSSEQALHSKETKLGLLPSTKLIDVQLFTSEVTTLLLSRSSDSVTTRLTQSQLPIVLTHVHHFLEYGEPTRTPLRPEAPHPCSREQCATRPR